MARGHDGEIIIAGGGIGGVSAALALARKGRRARVLEQAPEFKEVGAGIQIGPNVLRMFERLGVLDAVLRDASFPENLLMRDAISGEEVTRIPLGERFRARFGYPYALIYRADLLDRLIEACRQHPDLIALENSKKIVDFQDRGDGVVVTTADGETRAGAALIGCDGLRSLTRQRLVGDGDPRHTGQIAYRAVLPQSEVPEHLRPNDVVLWAGPGLHLAHYPMRGNALFNMGAIFHSERYEQGHDVYGDPQELHERFAGVCEPVEILLEKIEEWRMWVLFDRDPVETWTRGRVVLLGDAAHPMLQYLAQGAGMAIEDAVCLALEIERFGEDFAGAFGAYQQQRLLRTARVQLTSRFYGEIYHARGVARTLRNTHLRNRAEGAAHDSLAWLYDGI